MMKNIIFLLLCFTLTLFSKVNGLVINEVLAENSTINIDPDFKRHADWIELYNNSNRTIDLSFYALSDDENNLQKWEIPQGTKIKPKGYLLIWADGKYDKFKAVHTNFKLSGKGETLTLSDDEGNILDSIQFPKQKGDISCTKLNNSIVYMHPTPGKKNTTTYSSSKRAKEVKISLKSGFYSGGQTVTLSQSNGGVIYYTTDGSIPTKASRKYTTPIHITKTTILKATAFENGKFASEVSSASYFINEQPITLPVVSIGINPSYLYNNQFGIYKNYTLKTRKAATIQYFKNGQLQFSKNMGLALSGNQTRAYAQKSLAIFFKSKYGSKSLKYPLFRDKEEIKKVKSFVLRSSGNDWGFTMMKDGLVHTLIRDTMDLDFQSYEPAIVFINGQYWGIHNIREKTNEDFIEANHGVDSKAIDFLAEQDDIKAGSGADYFALLNYIKQHPLNIPANYNYVKSKMEIDEYINYMITELYVGNIDWPYNNIKYWKEQSSNGKWRWILYDTDDSFDSSDFDSLAFVLDETSTFESNPPWSTFLFRSLMKNRTFKEQFIGAFQSHLNITFETGRVEYFIETLKTAIEPEIQRHFTKWPRRNNQDWEFGDWGSIKELYRFANERPAMVRSMLSSHFSLSGNRTLRIDTPIGGAVQLDGILIDEPFQGKYFNNSMVRLKAYETSGAKFVKWSNGQTSKEITLKLNKNIHIKAIFQ
jgi:hypothetical protein